MERHQEGYEKSLSGNGARDVKVRIGYDEEKIKEIARESGSKAVKESVAYLRVANHQNRLYCEIWNEEAFFAVTFGKSHTRLYEMAVKESGQRKGYGRAMITRMKQLGQNKITLRTAKDETAIDFYRKLGGRITGETGTDYEVEI